ncbi:hypothetical protein Q5424_21585 [Conexibacter sp. JD483]|uniref:hypothetical protein n=1 Tax=unclassified Conexibacter TaxID=2627773 RepID=UPI002727ADEC|nr:MULTISPECIES: hypothetical protein [unclassified Conexibacter]MDO8189008.1 hypothetical protein [Conexibacter sp. CPCC 205706]MDO8201408.1 hypothetical protein [Conexibacter sp. CPCC 205762]MDR9371705.1 hypothetical protein [Conexibacter sp. JD483]
MAKIPHPHDALEPVAQANRRWNPIARRRAARERSHKLALAGRGGALVAAVGALAAALTWRARHRHNQHAQPA